jgi:hypothetical protein
VIYHRTDIPTKIPVKSLSWRGDTLVDSVAGGDEYHLDGTTTDSRVSWAYRFDAAVQSPSGRYVVIYEKLGTKGLIIRNGKLLRELNRSFYCAEAYEYPVTFALRPDGRELLIHCPDEYNHIEIEDAETGERLSAGTARKPADFFHSRLAVSGDGRWLLSSGWAWHPMDLICCFDISAALADPAVLDVDRFPDLGKWCEVNSAAFLGNDRLLLASSPEAETFREDSDEGLKPGQLGVFNLQENRFECVVAVERVIGTMMPVGRDYVVSFYEHPKLIETHTGRVAVDWPDVCSGKQNSSIIWHQDPPPPTIALDPEKRRFAVGGQERVTVIELNH